MKKTMLTLEETAALIKTGSFLALAADESILRQLPAGNWIGGTIPYFIGDQGGLESRDLVHVTPLAEAGTAAKIVDYTTSTISRIAVEAPDNGFSVVILPAFSAIHGEYAAHAQDYEDLFLKPIVGWISGTHLADLGKATPKVMNGLTGCLSSDQASVIHVPLPSSQVARVQILNLFRQGDGDVITFPKDGFTASDCMVNGRPANVAAYAQARALDPSRPLVADYHGAQINISFQSVDAEKGQVTFYAPVFAGVEYRQAGPVGDYVEGFKALVSGVHVNARFTCNCILNYLHGKLEGRKTGDFTGPMTFGEIGYQVLNQTLVYLEILDGQ
ncbi:MAG: hypothetical protein HY014_10810 [Acidobacteria bacterium]|nr:hypothetical protein [Acidobacteriota bacterium]MBI3488645.1 hypothetical protein [Acidobacteriota bacterium]